MIAVNVQTVLYSNELISSSAVTVACQTLLGYFWDKYFRHREWVFFFSVVTHYVSSETLNPTHSLTTVTYQQMCCHWYNCYSQHGTSLVAEVM